MGGFYGPEPEVASFQLTFFSLKATYNDKGEGVLTWSQAVCQRGEDGFGEQN